MEEPFKSMPGTLIKCFRLFGEGSDTIVVLRGIEDGGMGLIPRCRSCPELRILILGPANHARPGPEHPWQGRMQRVDFYSLIPNFIHSLD